MIAERDPPGHLTLRHASDSDVDWLLDLRLMTMVEHIEKSGQLLSNQEQRDRVLQDYGAIRIVEMESIPIGMMKVVRKPDRWQLIQIQLLPARQGQGLGSWLIRNLIAEAGRAMVPLSLHVLKVNPAKRLYDRLGFKVIADTGRSYELQIEHP